MFLMPGRMDVIDAKKEANTKQRITTKYFFPSQRPSALNKRAQSQKRQEQKKQQQQSQNETERSSQSTSAATQQQQELTTTPATPVANLTLKTYSPATGICLKYRTNKAAEVGRLITTLGKLAAGADVAGLGLSSAAPTGGAGGGGDVEITDAPPVSGAGGEDAAAGGKADTGAKGGKSKKKGGKGKR